MTSPGLIESTNHPNNYLPVQSCEWFIKFADGDKVVLNFLAFDIEYELICQYDWVEVRDGSDSNSSLIGSKMCGDVIPVSITSKKNELYVKFSSDGSGSKMGFAILVEKSNLTCMGFMTCSLNNLEMSLSWQIYNDDFFSLVSVPY